MTVTDLNELLPDIRNVIEYVGGAVAGGIIGNRADAWFANLYYHQKQRLLTWLQGWNMTEEDRTLIDNNEELKVLFSNVTSSVTNEIFDKKLLIWPSITESLLRNDNFEFNEKQYFINLFLKLDPFAIQYLAKLDVYGPVDSARVFPMTEVGNRPPLGHADLPLNLGQLQTAATGMVIQVPEGMKIYFKISDLGHRFVDFISNSSKEKLHAMAQ